MHYHAHRYDERGWQAFTDAQIERTFEIAAALHDHYRFRQILGHDDVAPERKMDPGPLFPMARLVAKLMGPAPTMTRLEAL